MSKSRNVNEESRINEEIRANKERKRVALAKKCQIPVEDRTLTALTKLDGQVYVYCGDRKTLQRFIDDAENEYFHYGDGVSLLERKPDDIMALNKNRTINFLCFGGRMAFQCADHLGIGEDVTPLIKVDYRKYIAGYQDFIYKP
ncbi:MAG: hypothetical protein LUG17_01440 [Clostridiales bacterium]|nr:hypothetical protein [Clostridiales bacterium]